MKAGIHDLSAAAYHADPCPEPSLSSSVVKVLLDQSPLHARCCHPRLNPDYEHENRKDFDLGTAAHAMVLEDFDDFVFIEAPNYKTKAAQEQRDAAYAAGKTPLLPKQREAVTQMTVAATATALDGLLDNLTGDAEQTLIWQEHNGVWCRARPDWLRNDQRLIADYKTTTDASPDRWIRSQLFGLGYDIQAAFYLRGLRALLGYDAAWRWVVQETKPPYAVSVVAPLPPVIELAEKKVERAIALWGECLRADRWPAYSRHVAWADLPTWRETQWLEREVRESETPALPAMAGG